MNQENVSNPEPDMSHVADAEAPADNATPVSEQAAMQALEAQLIALRAQCQTALTTRECGILHQLDQPGDLIGSASAPHDHHLGGVHP